jgi:hypothetical protein
LLVLVALIAPPHLAGLDRFATIDEPWWVISGSNFYYAITHGDFAQTIYDYHPAVTTTWVVTGGMLLTFPEYRGFGQGYFDVRKPNFDNFLNEHGRETRDLLRNSRLIQSLLLIGLALLLFFLLQKVVDPGVALASVALAFDAPFFLGHSRLLNHEGMLTMLMLVSLVGLFVYLHVGRRFFVLLLSGASFGLAQLTKSSSAALVVVIGLMLLLDLISTRKAKPLPAAILDAAKILAIWLGSAAVIYVLLWPGMWVAPGRMLYEVYGNALSYAFQGARLDVTQQLQPESFSLDTGLGGVPLYLGRLALRSTPVSWIGLALFVGMLFTRSLKPAVRLLSGLLGATAVLFIVMFGLARGRDSSHYILASFFSLDMIAGLGWAYSLAWLVQRMPRLRIDWLSPLIPVLIVLAQISSGLPYRPYYYTYANPLSTALGANPVTGYGEGLDQAAAYLAAKQDSEGLRVFAYAGMGPFSYFFPGRTEVMKKAHFLAPGLPDVIRGMRWSEYVVVYAAVQDRLPECAAFMAALRQVQPEHVIFVDGRESVRIYRSVDLPESVYLALAAQP